MLKWALVEGHRLEKRVAAMHADAHAAAICGAVAEAFCRPEHKLPATLSFLKGEPGTCSAGSRCISWQPARLRCAIVQPSGLIHWPSTCLCFGSSWHAASVVLLEDSSQPGGKLVYLKEPFIDSHGGNSGSGTGGLLNRPFCLSTALQGMLLASGDKRMYLLTDPALCTIVNRYGASDFGQDAMTDFLNNHTCGPLCMGLIETPQPPPHRHHWPCTIM